MFSFTAPSQHETNRLGTALAAALEPGAVVALNGPLGAGKTRFVQAIARALGVPRDVATSPTFVLVNEYTEGRLPIYHFDAYRVKDIDEFAELGPEEYFYGEGVCLIEWAERVAELLPQPRWEVDIRIEGESCRTFELKTVPAEQHVIDKVAAALVSP